MTEPPSTVSIVQPKTPNLPGWQLALWWTPPSQILEMGYPVQAWQHPESNLFVLSAVEVADEPGKPSLGPEFHISISKMGKRCTSQEAGFVLHAFDLSDATEDNHVPSGNVRNFWRPVADKLSGYECDCKEIEPSMVEDKGDYIWRGVTNE